MKASFSLKGQLLLLVGFAMAIMLVLELIAMREVHDSLMQGKRDQIESITQNAYSIAAEFHERARKGEMTEAQAQEAARLAIGKMRYGGESKRDEYMYIWTTQGVGVMHPIRPEFAGQNMLDKIKDPRGNFILRDLSQAVRSQPGGAFVDSFFPKPGQSEPVPKLQFVMWYQPWDWMIGTGVYTDEVGVEFRQLLLENALSFVLLFSLFGLAAWWLGRGVLRQVGGEPSVAIAIMSKAAQGDLSQSLPDAPPGSMLAAYAVMQRSLRELISQVRDEAKRMRDDAGLIADSVQQVTQAAARQSEATTAMAAAVQQLTVSVAHVSDASSETEATSAGVAERCRTGEERVNTASRSIREIADVVSDAAMQIKGLQGRANQINEIASSIKEIAQQTNLLALNAAIEAARAGEQGKGFSVVADEVRKLAERTASATVEIEQMLQTIQGETLDSVQTMERILPMVKEGSTQAGQVAESLQEIRGSADVTLHRVREVAHATREQTAASTAIAQRVEGIAQMVEQTHAAMMETERSATSMRDIASRLDSLVGSFRV